MSEEFIEENTKGEIIKFDKDDHQDGEQEGIKWGNIRNVFKTASNTIRHQFNTASSNINNIMRQQQEQARRIREQQERALREKAERERAEIMRVRNMENQIRQLSARVSQLESIIRDKDRLIDRKNKHIAFLTSENTRLRKKVNALLDNLQYYKTSVLGTDQVDGYKTTVVKQQLKIDELLQQEIGKPITATKDGFENLYEGFHYDYDSLKNEHIILEGYVDQAMSSYNAVFVENQAIQNHIDNTTNVYSINNQLTSNIIAKQNTL
jgi:chromosome segregation ATPase